MKPRALGAALVAATMLVALTPAAHAGRPCDEQPLSVDAVQRGMALAEATRRALDATGAQVVMLARAGQDLSAYGLRWSHLGFAYREGDGPSFSVENLRLVSRVGPNGNQINQIVFSLVQRAGVRMEDGKVVGYFTPNDNGEPPKGGMQIRGGCTLIFDLDTLKLKYAITKPLLDTAPGQPRQLDVARIAKQAAYQNDGDLMAASEYSKFFGQSLNSLTNEPFALLHHH